MKESLFRRLLNKFLSGRITPGEESSLERFDHELMRRRRASNAMDKKQVWNEIDHRIQRESRVRVVRLWTRAAASVAALFALAYSLHYFNQNEGWFRLSKPIEWVEQTAQPGQRLEITLADGTTVKLNSGSSLSYPKRFTGQENREIRLKGEAYFQVTRNPSQPFVVSSGPLKTAVLGTAFNIRKTRKGYQVAVEEGKVKVSDSLNRSGLLTANEKMEYTPDALVKSRVDFNQEVGWIRNLLIFDGVTAEELLQGVEKWYGVELDFNPSLLPKGTYKVSFGDQPFYLARIELAQLLCLEFASSRPRQYTLKPRTDCQP